MLRAKSEFRFMLVYGAMRQLGFLIALLAVAIICSIAFAADGVIRGTFRPDPLNPGNQRFNLADNEMPAGGFCRTVGSRFCLERQYAEFRIPREVGSHSIPANSVGNNTLTLNGRGDWHAIDIVNEEGIVNSVQIRLTGLFAIISPDPARYGWSQFVPGGAPDEDTAFNLIFGAGKDYFGGCRNYNFNDSGSLYMAYVEFSPGAYTRCELANKYDIRFSFFSISTVVIEVLAPNPLSMKSGRYTGYFNFTKGYGADIDFGIAAIPGPHQIELDLVVEHAFGVQFPGGSKLLSLVPEGGWMAWLQRGRKPTRLFRDQHFNIQSSTPFKMRVMCEFTAGASCGIQNGLGHKVPLDISVTLPGGFHDTANQPVTRYPLTSVASPSFKPDGYQVKRATLHFEVPKAEMETMLNFGGTRYSGTVTVIFEPDL